jgi:hypothetical protein
VRAEVKEVVGAAAPEAAAPPPAATPEGAAESESDAAACRNCGAALAGEFCHECGERRPDGRRDLSLRHFAGEAVQEFTSLEHSKLLRTLGSLLFRPGLLTREYFAGRRGRYLKPLTLFLAALALNFVAYSYAGPFTAREMIREEERWAQREPARWYARQAARMGISTEEFITRVSEKLRAYGGLAVVHVFNVLLFALLLRAVLPRTRRYFVEHLVFSIHFVTLSLLAQLVAWPAYLVESWPPVLREFWVRASCTLAYAVYLFFAARTFYGGGPGRNLFRSLALAFGFTLISVLAYFLTYVAALYAATRPAA